MATSKSSFVAVTVAAVGVALLLACAVVPTVAQMATNPDPSTLLWPLPSSLSFTQNGAYVCLPDSSAEFKFDAADVSTDVLQQAFERYSSLLFPADRTAKRSAPRPAGAPTISTCTVTVRTDVPLSLSVNESYSLSVDADGAVIEAHTVWGALHALETFSQLVVNVGDVNQSAGCFGIIGAPLQIADAPEFAHRGLMIDTARHFLAIDTIQRTIDGLAYAKMNVLHWHIVDAESFPVETPSYPDLANAAYSPDMIYSLQDITNLVAYANARGVVVIPEFDIPGHSYAWGIGYSNLTAKCAPYAANINNIPLTPYSFTFDVLSGVYSDMSVFTSEYWHAGGDEVIEGCWSDDSDVVAWMQEHSIADTTALYQYFISNSDQLLIANNRTVIHWQEVFDNGLSVDSSAIIQVWKNKADMQDVINAGYRVLLSDSDKWYLNCGFNPGCTYTSWQDIYGNLPLQGLDVSGGKRALVLGGEVAMWSEFADDVSYDPQVWPRAAVGGERLWVAASVDDTTTAWPRLISHRCRMVNRGFQAAPIHIGFCPEYLVL